MRQSVVKQDAWGSGERGHPRRIALGGVPKHTLDVCVAGIALVVLTPIALTAALLICLSMGKPVVLREGTVGFEGKQFARYKFRTTMVEGSRAIASDRGRPFSAGHVHVKNNQSWVEILGAYLRACNLARLPQLLSVLRGDMSLVGPQAITPEHLAKYCAQTPEVLLAKPSLTGMRSSIPRSLATHPTRMALDRHYVNHWSMWLDLKILCGALARAPAYASIQPPK